MEVKNDTLIVNPVLNESVGGAKLEPEEMPVTRRVETDIGTNAVINGKQMVMGGAVSIKTTAAGAVNYVMNQCFSCKFFRKGTWLEYYKGWAEAAASDPIKKTLLDQFHSQIVAQAQVTDPATVAKAVNNKGICKAYTDALLQLGMQPHEALLLVEPLKPCIRKLATERTGVVDFGDFPYEPRDEFVDADRNRRREEILTAANAMSKITK